MADLSDTGAALCQNTECVEVAVLVRDVTRRTLAFSADAWRDFTRRAMSRTCGLCGGSGKRDCPYCNTGCTICDGTGQVICPDCRGTGSR